MKEEVFWGLAVFLLILHFKKSQCSPSSEAMAPDISPNVNPQPFLPFLAPSPLTPFTNNSTPVLSGQCALNFSVAESLLSVTATDCWASFAPYLANVVCCPQFSATLAILIGQSSKFSGILALNISHARHCLSDVEKILESRGANVELKKICSIRPKNLTESACPVIDVDSFESIVDTSKLLTACEKIDPINECCDQVCQSAILDSANRISLNDMSNSKEVHVLHEYSSRLNGCKNIVLRWLTSKLELPSANRVLRGLSNCKINEGLLVENLIISLLFSFLLILLSS